MMSKVVQLMIAGVVCAAAGLSAAAAQTPVSPDTPSDRSSPQDPRSTGSICRGGNLSERLEHCDGVIPPPSGITPDNTIEPPDIGTTPVIPPPGTPGGNQQIIPK